MSRMPSNMKHRFSEVPHASIQRSTFDRSCTYKSTFPVGKLIPVFYDEVLPGDTFSLKSSFLVRLATPAVPIMDNMKMDFHVFAVPNRLVWDNWQYFCGEKINPDDTTEFVCPEVTAPAGTGWVEDTLFDYLGWPTGVEIDGNAFWSRAYNLIYNEWYRDENLQDHVVVDKDDGPDDPTDYVLLNRNKRHDYFTSALPWPQKGPAVSLPLGETAPVLGIGIYETGGNPSFGASGTGVLYQANATETNITAGVPASQAEGNWRMLEDPANTGYPLIYADLSDATAATINDLREAFQIQKMYEKDARGGTRYTEIIRAHFGVTSPDARLQRPEFLGSFSCPISINPVAQTSSTTGGQALGDLAAFGTAVKHGHVFTKSFTEHCVIIGLASVRADLTYQQGMDRMFSRRTRWDFFWPSLAHLGEQAVLNKEIYAQGTSADDDVFGYQERYAEYRYKNSKITGAFRSNYSGGSLDNWHLSQEFGSLPTLGSDFIEENPPLNRCLAVDGAIQFKMDAFFNLKCARPMPVYGVPGLIDHF